MQLTIASCRTENGSTPEWFLIELQGSLETTGDISMAGRLVGDLHFTLKGDPIFIIGNHVLHGKEVKIDKPFAVLEKIPQQNDESAMEVENVEEVKPYYQCMAFIKHKLVFKIRPKPIVVPKKV